MSFIVKIIDTVLKESEKRKLKKISRIKVNVGEMTGALPEYLKKYFHEASKGTILEDTVLEVESVPVAAKCLECENVYEPDRSNGYCCPVCKSSAGHVIRGRDIVVDSIICK